jgi:hypothetical protein
MIGVTFCNLPKVSVADVDDVGISLFLGGAVDEIISAKGLPDVPLWQAGGCAFRPKR